MAFTIRKRTILPMILFIVAIIPSPIINYLGIGQVINLLRYGALIFGLYIEYRYKLFAKKKWIPLHLWFIWQIVSTFINHQPVYSAIQNVYVLFEVFVLAFYLSIIIPDSYLKHIAMTLGIMMILNYITMLMGGLYQETYGNMAYFFGIRVNINDIWPFAIAFLLFEITQGRRLNRIIGIIGIFCGCLFIFREWVSTAIVTLGVYFVVLIYGVMSNKWKNQKKWFRICAIGLMAGIVLFAFNPKLERFGWLIEGFLGETMTMDGRTEIWHSCLSQMKGISWIIGNGAVHNKGFIMSNGMVVNHPHNQYLAILFNFGLVGLGLYIRLIIDQVNAYMKESDGTRRAIFGACVLASMVMGITATYYTKQYWILWYTVAMVMMNTKSMSGKAYRFDNK